MGRFALQHLPNHFPPLHGLRVLAIVGVLAVHVTWGLHFHGLMEETAWYRFTASLWFGMDLFFVLSGFLIGTLLLAGEPEAGFHRIGRFYARRCFRIFPLYYVALGLLVLIEPASELQLAALWAEAAYLTNYYPFETFPLMPWAWSLCVEEHFYLLVPLLLGILRFVRDHRRRLLFLGGLWLVAPTARLLALIASENELILGQMFAEVYQRTHTRFDTLVAGIFIAYLHRHFEPELRQAVSRRPIRLSLRLLALSCLAFLLLPPEELWRRFLPWHVVAWGSITSVMYLAVLLLLLYERGGAARLLAARPFLTFATLGYGIYLVHIPVFHRLVVPALAWLEALVPPLSSLRWALALALLWTIASASAYVLHLLVERPSLWLRDRLAP